VGAAVSDRGGGWSRHVRVVLGAVLEHPSLWWPALGAVRRLARRGWWHRAPFLPVPGDAYWHFRLVTAYGGDGSGGDLTKEDVVAFLRWCQRTRPPGG
jgi:hypothetical protein